MGQRGQPEAPPEERVGGVLVGEERPERVRVTAGVGLVVALDQVDPRISRAGRFDPGRAAGEQRGGRQTGDGGGAVQDMARPSRRTG
ncbi:hypothetical protein BKA01_003391 [Pseudonocardia eucalypti]|uniref:hypothetical protein n=1 Tax=Pseudonocardia eucalypti TaxID=648755 RepID=UPI001619D957|nr:hypothetical protein [Pseudonocardia eucalypti]